MWLNAGPRSVRTDREAARTCRPLILQSTNDLQSDHSIMFIDARTRQHLDGLHLTVRPSTQQHTRATQSGTHYIQRSYSQPETAPRVKHSLCERTTNVIPDRSTATRLCLYPQPSNLLYRGLWIGRPSLALRDLALDPDDAEACGQITGYVRKSARHDVLRSLDRPRPPADDPQNDHLRRDALRRNGSSARTLRPHRNSGARGRSAEAPQTRTGAVVPRRVQVPGPGEELTVNMT